MDVADKVAGAGAGTLGALLAWFFKRRETLSTRVHNLDLRITTLEVKLSDVGADVSEIKEDSKYLRRKFDDVLSR